MKDIYAILQDYGVSIAEEKRKDFEKDLFGNYKTIAEMSKKDESISALTDQLNAAKEGLKKFDGINIDDLRGQITKLNGDLENKEIEWKNKFAAREFDYSIENAIANAKGRNAKAIKALLDVEALRTSSNQGEDIKNAIENLKKENGYLFVEEPTPGQYAGSMNNGSGKTGNLPSFF